MTKRDILSIAFKILGITSIMNAVMSINGIGMGIGMLLEQAKSPNTQNYYNPYWFLGTTIVTLVLWLALAYALLRWGDLFAQKLVHDDNIIQVVGPNEWERHVFILSLRVIGVVCLIKSVPELVKVILFLRSIGWHQGNKGMTSYVLQGIVTAIVLIIIGIYLLSDGKHLVKCAFKEKAVDK